MLSGQVRRGNCVMIFFFAISTFTIIQAGRSDAQCRGCWTHWQPPLSCRPLWSGAIFQIYAHNKVYITSFVHDSWIILDLKQYLRNNYRNFDKIFLQEMTNSFNNLLITLTIFDTTFIVFMLFDYTSFRGNSSRYHQLSLTQTFHVQINFTFHFPLSLLSFFILQFGSGPSTTRQLCMLTSSPRFMSHLIFISYLISPSSSSH